MSKSKENARMEFDAYQPPNGKWADWDADAPVQPLTMSAEREEEIRKEHAFQKQFESAADIWSAHTGHLLAELDETRKRLNEVLDWCVR